jgi:Ni/Co efflux regulator RcnB
MLPKKTLWFMAMILFAFAGMAFADDHGHGKHHDRDGDGNNGRGNHYYSEHDRDEIRRWHHDHGGHLPPGLAKRDELPPGLERQLRVRGTLPPGLRKKMSPCPEDLERRLPPPPRGCVHVLVGGNLVLVNRSSYVVLDVFHLER